MFVNVMILSPGFFCDMVSAEESSHRNQAEDCQEYTPLWALTSCVVCREPDLKYPPNRMWSENSIIIIIHGILHISGMKEARHILVWMTTCIVLVKLDTYHWSPFRCLLTRSDVQYMYSFCTFTALTQPIQQILLITQQLLLITGPVDLSEFFHKKMGISSWFLLKYHFFQDLYSTIQYLGTSFQKYHSRVLSESLLFGRCTWLTLNDITRTLLQDLECI